MATNEAQGLRPPGREQFLSILEAYGAPEHVKRHCMAVGSVAVRICAALEAAGVAGLCASVVRLAAHLHDICRADKDHDEAGAALLREADFSRYGIEISDEVRLAAADIVKRHMKLDFPDDLSGIDDAVVVSLADRTVKEDSYVGYEARMEDLLRRYAYVPEVVLRVHENMERTMSLIAQIENITGRPFREIATGGCVDAASLFSLAERPGRYIGGEIGSVRKEWDEVLLRFCFAFPDLYEIGMSYTGMQIIYGLLNARADTLCERAFAPAKDMEDLLSERGLPLFSLENKMPLRSFDVIGFTLQYELCYTNVVRMLGQAHIPLYAKERGKDDPFVIAGGPCCVNAEPVAPFFDLVCVGDGEDMLNALADVYLVWKEGGGETADKGDAGQSQGGGVSAGRREAFLRMASEIEGVYAPGFYEPVYAGVYDSGEKGEILRFAQNDIAAVQNDGREGACNDFENTYAVFSHYVKKYEELPDTISRAAVPDLDAAFFPVRPLVSHIESVHDRVSVEIMRGCYRKCRFCQASYACDGVRRRSAERIKELVYAGLANTGYDEVTLLSLSTGDYPGIEGLVTDLMAELGSADATLSMPSLRLDTLKTETLEKIAEYKRSGLTFAPEAGTQRLRDLIGKQITEDDILRTLDICLPLGFTKFKFYFMIGLPTETYEDLDGIAALAAAVLRHVKALGAAHGQKYHFNLFVSVSNFVPKPATPFERARGDSEQVLLEKIHYLRDAVRKVKGVGFKYHDTRMSRVEMLLAKGDRRAAEAVRLAAERGAGFDSWREHFSYENWLSAFRDAGLPAEDLYADCFGGAPSGKDEILRFAQNDRGNVQNDRGNAQNDRGNVQNDRGNVQNDRGNAQNDRENEGRALPWSLIGIGKAYGDKSGERQDDIGI